MQDKKQNEKENLKDDSLIDQRETFIAWLEDCTEEQEEKKRENNEGWDKQY